MENDSKTEDENSYATPLTIQTEIYRMVADGYDIIDAVLTYCDEHDLEYTKVKGTLTTRVLSDLRKAFEERGMLEKAPELPM